jgi:hypothetical protein
MLRFVDTSDAVSASEVSELLNDSARLPCAGSGSLRPRSGSRRPFFETADFSLASVRPPGQRYGPNGIGFGSCTPSLYGS